MFWSNPFSRPKPRVHVIEPVQRVKLLAAPTFLKTGRWVEWGGTKVGILTQVGMPESTVRVVLADGSEGEEERVPVGLLNITTKEKIPFTRRIGKTDEEMTLLGY